MKKITAIISCTIALFAMTSCDWFKLDNLDGWDAQVEGKILDAATNEPVQMEQSSALSVYELYGEQYDHTNQDGKKGWDGHQAINWLVKNNGTYVNKLTFAGDYEMDTRNNNFKADPVNFSLKKGSNTVDFKVTPYLRIKNTQISTSGEIINAKFDVEVGVPGTKISRVEICVFPDRFVRHSQNNCANDPNAFKVNPTDTHFELFVDPNYKNSQGALVNAAEFQYKRAHYIRVAALGQNASNSGSAYNYSAVYKLENGTITEVTDW